MTRGTALPETALVLGVSLVVVLGAVQATVIGYSQLSADGAAFMAAHTTAVDSSANASSVVASSFPNFQPDAVSVASPSPNLQQAIVTKSVDGFTLIPGMASSYALSGADVEYRTASSQSEADFTFAISASLNNYCDDSDDCAPRSMYLAQYIDSTGSGNGWNGTFAEWRCHQQYFASLNWPSTRPAGGLVGSPYDPQQRGTTEYAIYSWDTGTSCK